MRALLAIALSGALLPGQAMAQKQIIVAKGEAVPALRPCIDYAGQGALHMTGQVDDISPPDDLLGHGRYHLNFTEHRALFGPSEPRPGSLFLFGHALREVHVSNALVLLQRSTTGPQLAGWAWVWTDTRGWPFVPVFEWPNAERSDLGWPPAALKRFARPVAYRDPQPFFANARWTDLHPIEYAEDGLFETRGQRATVRYGLYLADIPAMLKAADLTEDCWR